MGKFSYTDLMELDLGRLAAAVSDWKAAVTKLTELAGDSRDGLLKKSEGARWQGVNASVTRDFVRKTAKEFGDLSLQARSIHAVLGDAHSELTRIQKRARELTAEAKAGNPDRKGAEPDIGLLVTDGGNGTVIVTESVCDAEGPSTRTEDLKRYYADAITSLISHAAEVDAATVRALKAAHGGDPHNAGHARYSSLDEDQLPRAMRLASLGENANPGQRAELGRLWDSLSPDARAELWGRHRSELLAAGLLDPRAKQVSPDRGMGRHGSKGAGFDDHVTNKKMELIADLGEARGWNDAARHMRHYLGNDGEPLELPVDRILREDDRFKELMDERIVEDSQNWRKEALEEYRRNGGNPVSLRVESESEGFTFPKDSNGNWYYAAGSIQSNATGVVTVVPDEAGHPKVELEYQINVWDRYNWDEGKGVNILGVGIPDGEMGRQHTVGLAREYDMAGSSSVYRHSLGGEAPNPGALPVPTDSERPGERPDGGRGPKKLPEAPNQ